MKSTELQQANGYQQQASREIQVGDFYWIPADEDRLWQHELPSIIKNKINGNEYLLAVVENVTSNAVDFYRPVGCERGYQKYGHERFFLHNHLQFCIYEPNGLQIVQQFIQKKKKNIDDLVNKLTLTAQSNYLLPTGSQPSNHPGTDLVIYQQSQDLQQYKQKIERMKSKEIPEIQSTMKQESYAMTAWMPIESIALQNQMKVVDKVMSNIQITLDNISIYAGLDENIMKIQDGDPAGIDQPINIFQTLLYMDEESLIDYQAGGMEFSDIESFDRWLCKPCNLSRILSTEKSVVGFQVRRNAKARDSYYNDRSPLAGFINARLQQQDKWTFLYIRNGQQVYRVSLENYEFDKLLFNSNQYLDKLKQTCFVAYNPNYKYGMETSTVDKSYYSSNGYYYDKLKFITEQQILDIYQDPQTISKSKQQVVWHNGELCVEDPDDHTFRSINGINREIRPSGKSCTLYYLADQLVAASVDSVKYEKYSKSMCKWFDEVARALFESYAQDNKFFFLLQGLLDRSEVFHPIPQISMQKQINVQLLNFVKDSEDVLPDGEKPDLQKYLNHLKGDFKVGDLLYGHREYWEQKELQAYRQRGYRNTDAERYHDYMSKAQNPGPSTVHKIAKIVKKKDGSCDLTLQWQWVYDRWDRYYGREDIQKSGSFTINSSVEGLYNLSKYNKGDYLKFYLDRRTRIDYLQWAKILLTAENLFK